ncbi:MAG TPA: hypothetical protein VH253_19335 [Phycisphaerae bacterium]|nr:hypothetical protein [Phycisphaerae bacterium]
MRKRRPIRAGICTSTSILTVCVWLLSYRTGYLYWVNSPSAVAFEGRGSIWLFRADNVMDDFGLGSTAPPALPQRLDAYQESLVDRALWAEFPHGVAAAAHWSRWSLCTPFWPFALLFALLALRDIVGRRVTNPQRPLPTIPAGPINTISSP